MSDPMTDARLDEISALADAATPGPWGFDPDGVLGPHTIVAEVGGYERMIGAFDTGEGDEADADKAFVLAARTAVPEMAAEIRRLRAENAELEKRDDWLRSLEAAGVDNWEGIDAANEIHEREA